MYCLCRQKGCGQEAMMMGLITNTVMVHKDAQHTLSQSSTHTS